MVLVKHGKKVFPLTCALKVFHGNIANMVKGLLAINHNQQTTNNLTHNRYNNAYGVQTNPYYNG